MKKTLFLIIGLLVFSGALWAQNISITGKVSSKDNGEPIPGVSVLVKGDQRGTITNVDGVYQLEADANATLAFSFIGMESQEVSVNGRKVLNVVLTPKTEELDDVVVIAYGKQKKSDLTGAVSGIQSKDIQKVQSSRVENALEGKVSGVIVTPVGQPGGSPNIYIRGFGSVNDNNPIYVVDGMVLYSIDHLNPSDIESISVLKDASAAAMYGARGGNGVIMVTTKKGVSGEGKVTVNYYRGAQKVTNYPDMVSPQQYAQLVNELTGEEKYANPSSLTGTNWYDEIFQVAPVANYNVAFTGGNEKNTYHVSASYFEQEGVVKGDEYNKLSLLFNNSYKVKSWLKVGHNIQFAYIKGHSAPGGLIDAAYITDPLMSVYDEEGNYGQSGNGNFANIAAKYEYEGKNKNKTYKTIGNGFVEVALPFDLSFKSNVGVEATHIYGKSFNPKYVVSPWQKSDKSSINVNNSRFVNISWENLLSYHKEIGAHRFDGLAGISSYYGSSEWLSGGRNNVKGESEEFWYLDAGTASDLTEIWNGNSGSENTMLSYLFRVNYTLKDRYLLTATMRRDGSSRFGEKFKYGNFPSFAAGWRISEESFFEPIKDVVSNLKLRASWGLTGNDRIGDYAAYPGVATGLDVVFGTHENKQEGATVTELTNTSVRWEKHEQLNVGFEAGLFNNKLTMEMDYYRRVTKDMLLNGTILAHTGYTGVGVVNIGSIENKGWDVNLNWRETRGDFAYSVGLIGSTVQNEVLKLSKKDDVIWGGDLGNGRNATRTIVGESIGHFYGYQVDGIFQNDEEVAKGPKFSENTQPGDIRYKDLNNDGEINDKDKTIIGSPHPDLILGLNLSASYKGFDLSASLSGQFGRDIYNRKKAARFGNYNFEASYWDRWHGEGTSNSEPRVTNSGDNYEVSDRFLEDGSYLRIGNLALGYTLPKVLSSKVKMEKVRFYVSGSNLYTFTDYSGFDPIIGGHPTSAGLDWGSYPVPATYTIGVNIEF